MQVVTLQFAYGLCVVIITLLGVHTDTTPLFNGGCSSVVLYLSFWVLWIVGHSLRMVPLAFLLASLGMLGVGLSINWRLEWYGEMFRLADYSA